MCLELMIERAKENVSLGEINICVRNLEGLPGLRSHSSINASGSCMGPSAAL